MVGNPGMAFGRGGAGGRTVGATSWPRLDRAVFGGRVRFGLVAMAATALLATLAASPASAATVTQPVPGTNALQNVGCSSATTCVAVGYGPAGNLVVPITNGLPGTPVVAPVRTLGGVACPNTTTCLVVGNQNGPPIPPSTRPSSQGVVMLVTNGVLGAPQVVTGTQSLVGVACPGTNTCYALGTASTGGGGVVVTLTADGSLVAVKPLIPGPYESTALACTSTTTCYGVGAGDPGSGDQGVVVPITNGVPGSAQFVSGTAFLYDVGCSSATTCYAVGLADNFSDLVLVPITNGVAGAPQVVPNVSLGAIACPSATTCYAVGFNDNFDTVVVPIVNGTPGTPQVVPESNGFQDLACANAATCVAVGSNTSNQGVVAVIHEPPTDANACKNGGWKLFSTPVFKNQGACVKYVQTHSQGQA